MSTAYLACFWQAPLWKMLSVRRKGRQANTDEHRWTQIHADKRTPSLIRVHPRLSVSSRVLLSSKRNALSRPVTPEGAQNHPRSLASH